MSPRGHQSPLAGWWAPPECCPCVPSSASRSPPAATPQRCQRDPPGPGCPPLAGWAPPGLALPRDRGLGRGARPSPPGPGQQVPALRGGQGQGRGQPGGQKPPPSPAMGWGGQGTPASPPPPLSPQARQRQGGAQPPPPLPPASPAPGPPLSPSPLATPPRPVPPPGQPAGPRRGEQHRVGGHLRPEVRMGAAGGVQGALPPPCLSFPTAALPIAGAGAARAAPPATGAGCKPGPPSSRLRPPRKTAMSSTPR